MALWDKVKAEFVDIIEWTDDSRDTMVWRFPRYQNEIKYGAKLTVRELESTLGEPLRGERAVLRGMRDLMGMGARNVFVTQGGQAAYLLTPNGAWRYTPPALARRVNPIGSGDCTTAGLVHALLLGESLRSAVRFGLACGSANVESLTPADLDVERVRRLVRDVKAQAL